MIIRTIMYKVYCIKVKPDWLYIEVWRARFHLWKSGNSDVWWTLKSHATYRKTVCYFYYDGLWLPVVGRINKVLLLLWCIFKLVVTGRRRFEFVELHRVFLYYDACDKADWTGYVTLQWTIISAERKRYTYSKYYKTKRYTNC